MTELSSKKAVLFLALLTVTVTSCAYIRQRTIEVPPDIASQAKVEVLPDTQQTNAKELVLRINLLRDKILLLRQSQDFKSIIPLAQDITLSLMLPGTFPVISKEPQTTAKETEAANETVQKQPAAEATATVTAPEEKIKPVKSKKNAPVTRIVINPFRVGESITMRLEYLGLTAAYLKMETLPYVLVDGKKAFHFRGTLDTSTLMNILYKAHDTLDEYIDYTNFVPLKEEVHLNETKQNMEQIVIYDHKNKKAIFWKKKLDKMENVSETRREDAFVEYALDVPSMLSFLRTQNLVVGGKLVTIVYDNGKLWELTVDVLRTETINTDIGKMETLLLKPTLRLGGQVQEKGELLLWISNDARKIPLKFKAKAKIGAIEGEIHELTGSME
jgi:hypothetical protein